MTTDGEPSVPGAGESASRHRLISWGTSVGVPFENNFSRFLVQVYGVLGDGAGGPPLDEEMPQAPCAPTGDGDGTPRTGAPGRIGCASGCNPPCSFGAGSARKTRPLRTFVSYS